MNLKKNKFRNLLLSTFLVSSLFSLQAFASSLNFNLTSPISASDYEILVRPIVTPARFQFMQRPVPLSGTIIPIGASAGLGLSYVNIPSSTRNIVNQYTDSSGNFPTYMVIPRLVAQVGLPFGIDLALNLTKVPNSDIRILGFAMQYAFFNPAYLPISAAVRIGYSVVQNFAPITAHTTNFEALVGFPILIITPYVGVGDSLSTSSTGLIVSKVGGVTSVFSQSASWDDAYSIIGVSLNFAPFVALLVEAQSSSYQTIINAKLSVSL